MVFQTGPSNMETWKSCGHQGCFGLHPRTHQEFKDNQFKERFKIKISLKNLFTIQKAYMIIDIHFTSPFLILLN